jgi:hypothetical protein
MLQRVREDLARVRIVIDNKDSWRFLFGFQYTRPVVLDAPVL